MPRQASSSWRQVVVGLVLVALVAAGCSNASSGNTASGGTSTSASSGTGATSPQPGVTANEIDFSVLATGSNNPLGTCVLQCYLDGINAYFAWRNSEGGVNGRKLVVPASAVYDDMLGQNQAQAIKIVSANNTFGTFSAPELPTGWANLAKAGIPTYVWADNPAQEAGQMTIFGHREVFCVTCAERWYPYIAKLAHAKKIGAVGYGVSQSSKDCVTGQEVSFKTYGKDVGASVVYTDGDLDFGLKNGIAPQVSAMKSAGVDMVVSCMDLNGTKTLAQELARQGMSHVVVLTANTYDQKFVADAGGVFNGDYDLTQFRPFEADAGDSTLATFKQWMAKAGKPISEIAVVGWINADEAYQGLKAAGPNFTRQSVVDATNKMTSYTAGGLVQPIDWSRQHYPVDDVNPSAHGPKYDCMSLVKVVDGKFVVVGDKSKPWICWPGNTTTWSDPTYMDFK